MKWLAATSALLIGAVVYSNSFSIPWTEEMVRGAYFESESDTGLLGIGFGSTGNFASGEFGDRNGAICGVVYEWLIDGSGWLSLIEAGGGADARLFKLVSYTEDSVEVREFFQRTTRYQRSKK